MWVPAYMRHMFWAGMRTTQRSESINSFFDGYVKRKTRLYEFVQQYVNAMESRVNDEKTADDDCARYTPHTVTNFKLEKTFRKIYTNGKFSEVQIECMKTIYVRPVQIDRVDDRLVDITLTDRVYVLNKKNRKEYATDKRRQYKVTFDTETKEASCVCKMFDSKGILCRHVIAVYDSYAVSDIPPKYILDRWRKDIKRKHTQIKVAHYDPTKTQDVKRFDRLNVAFDPLAIAACTDEEDVQIVIDMIYKASRLIEERRAKTKSTAEGDNIIQTPSSVGNGNMSGHSLEPVPPAIPSTPSHCIVGGTTEQQDSASEPHTPCISSPTAPHIYDPPTKKKPPNRPREKRFLSCLEKQPKNPRKRGKAAKESSSGESENQDFAHCVDYQLAPPPMLVQQAPVPLRPRPQPPAYQPPQSPAFHQVQPSAFQPVHSPAYGCPPADLYRCQQHLAYFNHGGHSYQIQYQGFRVPPPASHARSVGGVGSGHVNSLGYVTGSYAPYGEIQPWYGREGMGNFSTSSGPQSNGDTASTQCGSTT